jgi:peptide/nickel transport system substrate-binding protein
MSFPVCLSQRVIDMIRRIYTIICVLALGIPGVIGTFGLESCNRIQHTREEFMQPGSPVPGDVVFCHQLSDPSGLNPYTTNDNSAKTIYTLMFDGMLEQDPSTTEFVANLVDSLPRISADHLSYTWHLRKGIFFSDGHPLTSADVVFSFKAIKNPLILDASPLRVYFDDVVDVQATDSLTIVITMRKPYFMADIQLGDLRIVPKHIMDPKGLTDRYTIRETNDTNLVTKNPAIQEFADWFGSAEMKRDPKLLIGSGPYALSSWSTGEQVVLKKSQRPWNSPCAWRRGYADAIVGVIINDRTAAMSAMKTEDIDFFESVPPPMFDEQLDTTRIPYIAKAPYEQSVYSYVGWNSRKPQFADKRVRQALCHLFNREYLIKTVMRGYAVPIDGPVYKNRPEYDSSMVPYDYNPEKAKQLLADAGWSDTDGDGVLDKTIKGQKVRMEFSINVNAGNETRENIAILFSNEAKRVGIMCHVARIEWSVFLKQNATHAFDAYIGSWVNDNIPSDPLQLWHSSQAENEGSNYVGFRNKRADELMELNRVEFDVTRRTQLMREFQQIVHEEAAYTFLWSPQLLALYNRRLANVSFKPVRPGYLVTEWFVPRHLQSHMAQ